MDKNYNYARVSKQLFADDLRRKNRVYLKIRSSRDNFYIIKSVRGLANADT